MASPDNYGKSPNTLANAVPSQDIANIAIVVGWGPIRFKIRLSIGSSQKATEAPLLQTEKLADQMITCDYGGPLEHSENPGFARMEADLFDVGCVFTIPWSQETEPPGSIAATGASSGDTRHRTFILVYKAADSCCALPISPLRQSKMLQNHGVVSVGTKHASVVGARDKYAPTAIRVVLFDEEQCDSGNICYVDYSNLCSIAFTVPVYKVGCVDEEDRHAFLNNQRKFHIGHDGIRNMAAFDLTRRSRSSRTLSGSSRQDGGPSMGDFRDITTTTEVLAALRQLRLTAADLGFPRPPQGLDARASELAADREARVRFIENLIDRWQKAIRQKDLAGGDTNEDVDEDEDEEEVESESVEEASSADDDENEGSCLTTGQASHSSTKSIPIPRRGSISSSWRSAHMTGVPPAGHTASAIR
jgi:hypothetical protein